MIGPQYRVASGPTKDTDWCVIDDPPKDCIAPGGVVLCWQDTQDQHPDAKRAAESAWAMLRRWAATISPDDETLVVEVDLPPIAPGPRLPAPPLGPRWRRT